MTKSKMNSLKDRAARMKNEADSRLSKFVDRFQNNAADAFEWSQDDFKAAAEQHVAVALLYWIGAAETNAQTMGFNEPSVEAYENIVQEITGRVVRGAEFPARSTSVPSNLISQEIVAAFARILEAITR